MRDDTGGIRLRFVDKITSFLMTPRYGSDVGWAVAFGTPLAALGFFLGVWLSMTVLHIEPPAEEGALVAAALGFGFGAVGVLIGLGISHLISRGPSHVLLSEAEALGRPASARQPKANRNVTDADPMNGSLSKWIAFNLLIVVTGLMVIVAILNQRPHSVFTVIWIGLAALQIGAAMACMALGPLHRERIPSRYFRNAGLGPVPTVWIVRLAREGWQARHSAD